MATPLPRTQDAPRRAAALGTQVPDSCPSIATLRDNLAIGNERLDQMAPDALDLAAESISLMADALRGRASRLCGQHSDHYRRGQLIGRHALTVPDLAWLAIEAPEVCRAALIPLAAACGFALTPIETSSHADLGVEAAEMTLAAARLGLTVAEVEKDGVRTEEERRRVLAECEKTEQEVADIKAVALDPDLWRPEVSRRVAIHQAQKDLR